MTDKFTYLDSLCELVWPLPACCGGLSLDAFTMLTPDWLAAQAIFDQTFAGPTQGGLVVAALPFMTVSFGTYARAWSMAPGYSDRGAVSYGEVAVWLYGIVLRDVPNGPRAGDFVIHVPAIWVDQQYAITGGREVLGVYKGLGNFHIPSQPSDRALWSMETLAIPTYAPDAMAQNFRLLTVERTDAVTRGQPGDLFAGLEEAVVETLASLVSGGAAAVEALLQKHAGRGAAAIGNLARLAKAPGLPTLTLRQFRSGSSPTGASYQSIEYFEAGLDKLRAVAILGEYDVTVTPCDSHPIAQKLGFTKPVRAIGLHLEADLTLPLTTQVWP